MLTWLPILLSSLSGIPECVPESPERNRSEIAAPASFESFMTQIESIDIDSRDSVASVLGAALTPAERTHFHQMWDGTAVRSPAGPGVRVDYREGIAGATGNSMLVVDVLSPQFTRESAEARYPQMRLTGMPAHGCPLETWSYEVPGHQPRLVLSFDHSNSYLRTVILRSR